MAKKAAPKKRFTFADAKAKISELEDQLAKAIDIIDNTDNTLTKEEVAKVKKLEIWAYVGPVVGFLLANLSGLIMGYFLN